MCCHDLMVRDLKAMVREQVERRASAPQVSGDERAVCGTSSEPRPVASRAAFSEAALHWGTVQETVGEAGTCSHVKQTVSLPDGSRGSDATPNTIG